MATIKKRRSLHSYKRHRKINFLAITTGDPDGIGLEVSAKALAKLGPQKNMVFVLFRSRSLHKKNLGYLSLLDKKFTRLTFKKFTDLKLFLQENPIHSKNILLDYSSESLAPHWVEEAGSLCLDNLCKSMVTAPLSKVLIAKSGLKGMGHTEILRRISKSDRIHQAFVGAYFNVILMTSHIPLKDVPKKVLSEKNLQESLRSALELKNLLPASQKKKPLAMLGLNPHAGEDGLLGNEELTVLKKFCKQHKIPGPLSPDAAFLKENWNKYSVYMACYHDQGLIPFKTIHGQDSGIHISIGLPFLRTSVDHGTAKDIFGKNKANASSMIEAITFALRYKGK